MSAKSLQEAAGRVVQADAHLRRVEAGSPAREPGAPALTYGRCPRSRPMAQTVYFTAFGALAPGASHAEGKNSG